MVRCGLWALLSMVCLAPGFCPGQELATPRPQHVEVTGQVVDEASKGVAGVSVTELDDASADVSHATTDEQGRFTLKVAAGMRYVKILADHPSTDRLGSCYLSLRTTRADTPLTVTIVIAKCRRQPVEVLDAEGNAAAEVSVGAAVEFPGETSRPMLGALPTVTTDAAGKAELRLPANAKVRSFYAMKPEVGFDYRSLASGEERPEPDAANKPLRLRFAKTQAIRIHLVDPADQPVAGIDLALTAIHKPDEPYPFYATLTPKLFRATTGADGVAVFKGVPEWNHEPLRSGSSRAQYAVPEIRFDAKQHPDGNLTVRLQGRIKAHGHVQFADGKPAAGIKVSAGGARLGIAGQATTNDAGDFEMQLEPRGRYIFAVTDKKWAAPAIDGISAVPEKPIDGLKFELQPATRIHGRVTTNDKPVAGQVILLYQHRPDPRQAARRTPTARRRSFALTQPAIIQHTKTNDNGEFEFFAGPGGFRLNGVAGLVTGEFEITDQTEIELNFGARALPVEVVDSDGKPAADVNVVAELGVPEMGLRPNQQSATTDAAGKAELQLPVNARIYAFYAEKPDGGFDYKDIPRPEPSADPEWLKQPPVRFQLAKSQTIHIRLVDSADKPIVGTIVYLPALRKPDARNSIGVAHVPSFRTRTDTDGVAVFRVPAWNDAPLTFRRENNALDQHSILFDAKQHPDGNLTVKIDPPPMARGQVLLPDGKPAADIKVSAQGIPSQFARHVATTDADGRFQMQLRSNQLYMFVVEDKKWAAPVIDRIVTVPENPVPELKFQLRPVTRIYGRVTAGPDAKPVAGQRMSLQQYGRALPEGLTLPGSQRPIWSQPHVAQSAATDDSGEFEFFVGPGKFVLSGPSQLKAKTLDVADETEVELNLAAARNETGPVSGLVVTGEPPRPVANATVEGGYRTAKEIPALRLKTDAQGRFSGERYQHRVVLYAKSPDGKLAGIIQIEHEDKEATIPISPVASVKARVIDETTKAPLANARIRWGRPVHSGHTNSSWDQVFGGHMQTDDQGRFEVTGLVVRQEYYFVADHEQSSTIVLRYTPKQAGEEDVGDLIRKAPKPRQVTEQPRGKVAPLPPARPPTVRYQQALDGAAEYRQKILVVFHRKETTVDESWFEVTREDRKLQDALWDYRSVQVDVEKEGADKLAEQLGLSLAPDKLPAWSLRDSTGKLLEQGPIPFDPVAKRVNAEAVLEKLKHFAPERLDAQKLLAEALADAKKTNRRVLVQETAIWCGPCHMLARYLEAHRKIWEQDYIWVRMDERWTGCDKVMAKLQEKRDGIPWCAILDADGKTLATSDGLNGNIGFPVEPLDTEHFIKMLSSTRQRLTEEDLAALRKALEIIRKDLGID